MEIRKDLELVSVEYENNGKKAVLTFLDRERKQVRVVNFNRQSYRDNKYVDDPENSEIYYATTILDVDGSVRPLLDIPAPCAFMREDPDESFRVWDDFFQN